MQPLRTAIIVKKDLPIGQTGNICAILMAEIARAVPQTFATSRVTDRNGLNHAAPLFSIVVLKASGSEQLKNTAELIRASEPGLVVYGFSEIGQGLNNAFDSYLQTISKSATDATGLVGIAVSGEDAAVRLATKKFSVM